MDRNLQGNRPGATGAVVHRVATRGLAGGAVRGTRPVGQEPQASSPGSLILTPVRRGRIAQRVSPRLTMNSTAGFMLTGTTVLPG